MHASLGHHGGDQLGSDATPLAHLAVPAVGQVRDHSCHAPQREVEEEEEEEEEDVYIYMYIYCVAYCDFVV